MRTGESIPAQVGIEGAGKAANASEEELSVVEKERQESLGPRKPGLPGWAEAAVCQGNGGEMGRDAEGQWERVLTRPAVQCAQARSVVSS